MLTTDPSRLIPALLTLALGAPLCAQVPASPGRTRAQLEAEMAARAAAAGAPAGAPASADKAKEDAAKAQAAARRLAMLNAFVCDRSPSHILATWAAPEPKTVDDDPELKLPEAIGDAPKPPEAPKPPVAPTPVPAPKDPESEEHKKALEAFAAAQKEYATKKAEFDAAQKAHAEAMKAFAETQKEHQKKLAEYNKKKAEVEGKRLAREFEIIGRDVTLGRWARLKPVIEDLGKDEEARKKIYTTLLQKLPVPAKKVQGNAAMFVEKNQFDFDDVLAVIRLAPGGIDKKTQIPMIPQLVSLAMAQGHEYAAWLDLLRKEVARPEKERAFDKRTAALFVAAQGRDLDLGDFLPSLDEATRELDRVGLNLLARHYLARQAKEKKKEFLDQAWRATLAALAAGEIEKEDKQEALRRAVSLAPKVKDELGDAWLEESFTARPDRGMEVLATIGGEASQGLVQRAGDVAYRLATLKLMKSAIDALLTKAADRAQGWSDSLNLLADVWLREAQHSYKFSEQTQSGPRYQRDAYGNIYWMNYGYSRNYTGVTALNPDELLELRPTGPWYSRIAASVRPKYDTTIAELYLKVHDEKRAFPYIEQLAKTNGTKANELAKEFLNVWIQNNDPNAQRNNTNIYMFSYGYNNRASGIPLTRSRQERNLKDLAHWIGKLRGVAGIKLDTELLMRAFTASHSAAEVYRIETMEQVFGTLESLEPKVLATMAQTMRANLATVWRRPDVQKNAGTNRKQKDIELEVQKGYALAQAVLERALQVHPKSWQLLVARAAMIHDLNNYRNAIKKSSEFAGLRRAALQLFGDAVGLYATAVRTLEPEEESVEAFEYWFNAALGASDIPAIDQSTILARHEIPKIKAAIQALGGEVAERHMAKFANSLFTRLSRVNPAVKNRFLEAGFEIVDDHPQAREARREYEYFKDVVTEIKVVAAVDGPTDVGTEPFGLKVELHYTNQIEKESGGFGKYLQNQANAVNSYYYNYGRPQENYRDKFEESVRAALQEHFEVKSVTFNTEDVNSKATDTYGWRRTPYAYLLLKAKGPEVDRIPPLKLDLDFNDRTGYVVLPISSAVVPIDAAARTEARPFTDLEVTQILDERKQKEGALSLEIRARATGLVPPLDAVLDLAPSDFEIDDVEDQGVSVARFGDDKDSIRSERLWVVKMKAREGVENPTKFRFAAPRDEATKVLYQRYDDADLMTAALEVDLHGSYGEAASAWWMWALIPVVLLLGALGWRAFRPRESVAEQIGLQLPERLTPFSVLGLLRELDAAGRLSETDRVEIGRTIRRIEEHYFRQGSVDQPDLEEIARDWVRRA